MLPGVLYMDTRISAGALVAVRVKNNPACVAVGESAFSALDVLRKVYPGVPFGSAPSASLLPQHCIMHPRSPHLVCVNPHLISKHRAAAAVYLTHTLLLSL